MPDAGAHRGQRAVERMVEYAPSTGGLALWMRHEDLPADVASAPMSTDGHALHYAPGFERLGLAQQTGWVARGVMHVAFAHPRRLSQMRACRGDVDAALFALCADAVVDSSLAAHGWLELPAGSVPLETLLKVVLGIETDADGALRDWDVERLYAAIDDRRPGRGGRQGRSERSGQGGDREGPGRNAHDARGGRSDADTGCARAGPESPNARTAAGGRREDTPDAGDAGDTGARPAPSPLEDGPRAARARRLAGAAPDLMDDADRDSPESHAATAQAWADRLMRAHAGDGEFSMLRSLAAVRTDARVPWEQWLRTRLCRALSRRPTLSWSRPARSWLANAGRTASGGRMPWEPGRSSAAAVPRIVVVIDVSGSIEEALTARFAREIDAIARRLDASLTVVVGDDRVRGVTRFDPGRPGLQGMRFEGGGGTDFAPLLREADRHRPDIAVVLTDLQGPTGERPGWPVIWAVPDAWRDATAPFGRVLCLG